MSILLKTRTWLVILIALFLATFFLGYRLGCSRVDSALKTNADSTSQVINRYEIEVNKTKLYITEKEQEIMSLKAAVKQGLFEREYYRKMHLKTVDDMTYLQAEVDILIDSIAHTGRVIVVQPCDSIKEEALAIELPFSFQKDSPFYHIVGRFDSTACMSFKLNVPMDLTVWAGLDRNTNKYKAVVMSNNPHVTITQIHSMKLDLPKAKKFGIGVQAGYGMPLQNPLVLSPFLGVGIQYSIIRF